MFLDPSRKLTPFITPRESLDNQQNVLHSDQVWNMHNLLYQQRSWCHSLFSHVSPFQHIVQHVAEHRKWGNQILVFENYHEGNQVELSIFYSVYTHRVYQTWWQPDQDDVLKQNTWYLVSQFATSTPTERLYSSFSLELGLDITVRGLRIWCTDWSYNLAISQEIVSIYRNPRFVNHCNHTRYWLRKFIAMTR